MKKLLPLFFIAASFQMAYGMKEIVLHEKSEPPRHALAKEGDDEERLRHEKHAFERAIHKRRFTTRMASNFGNIATGSFQLLLLSEFGGVLPAPMRKFLYAQGITLVGTSLVDTASACSEGISPKKKDEETSTAQKLKLINRGTKNIVGMSANMASIRAGLAYFGWLTPQGFFALTLSGLGGAVSSTLDCFNCLHGERQERTLSEIFFGKRKPKKQKTL